MGNGNEQITQLSPELVSYLQGPQLVLVTTQDADTQVPSNSLITWVLAKDASTVRLAADSKGRVIRNIRANQPVLLTVLTNGACYTIEGVGKIAADELENVSLKVACAEIQVKAVRDITFWGGKITADPQWDVTYDQNLKEKLDTSVFTAMREL